MELLTDDVNPNHSHRAFKPNEAVAPGRRHWDENKILAFIAMQTHVYQSHSDITAGRRTKDAHLGSPDRRVVGWSEPTEVRMGMHEVEDASNRIG